MQPTLKHYINACCSLLWLDTMEFDRVMDEIIPSVFQDSKVPVTVFEWRPNVDAKVNFVDVISTKSRAIASTLYVKLRGVNHKTLANWLVEVSTYASSQLKKQPLVLVIYSPDIAGVNLSDANRLEDSSFYPILAETAKKFRFGDSFIFLVGPRCYVPPELSELVVHVPVPLPTQPELRDFIQSQVTSLKNAKTKITLPSKEADLNRLYDDAANAAVGLGYYGAETALALSITMHGSIDIPTIFKAKTARVTSSFLDLLDVSDESMETLAGFHNFKKWLELRRDVYSTKAVEYKLPNPKGVLFVGLPGVGKSTAAKVVASYMQLPLLLLDIGKLFQQYLGQSEAALREVIAIAEAVSPCVLWTEEVEKGLASVGNDSDGGVSKRLMGNLMHWRQETKAKVFMVATANDVNALPEAFYRKGRFDAIFAVGLPDPAVRIHILKIHLEKFGRTLTFSNNQIAQISKLTANFTGAEIQSLVTEALFAAFAHDRDITVADIIDAAKQTKPQIIPGTDVYNEFHTWAETRGIPMA